MGFGVQRLQGYCLGCIVPRDSRVRGLGLMLGAFTVQARGGSGLGCN